MASAKAESEGGRAWRSQEAASQQPGSRKHAERKPRRKIHFQVTLSVSTFLTRPHLLTMPSYEFSRGWIYSSVWSRMSSHLWTHETSGEHSRSKPLQRLFLRVPEEASILCFVTISCFSKQKWPESYHVTLILSSCIYTKMIVIIFGLLKYFTKISASWGQLITFLCWSGTLLFLFCVFWNVYMKQSLQHRPSQG